MEFAGVSAITFGTQKQVPVYEVANSLIASEKILQRVAAVLEGCYDGVTVDRIEISFREASSASPLKEILAAAVFLTYQEDLEREVPALFERATGVEVTDNYDTILTVLFIVIAVYGLNFAWNKFFPDGDGEKKKPASIEGDYNSVVNVAGNYLGVPPERITKALEENLNGNEKSWLASAATKFVRPAKLEKGATISGGGIEISSAAIQEAPDVFEDDLTEETERSEAFQDVEIIIHATDLDKTKTGWAGHINSVHEKRLRMELYPTISPDALFGLRSVRGDIILMSKRQSDGSYAPYMFHLVEIHEPE